MRNKVTDPAYAAWFMRFGPPTVGNGWHVPQCDTNYDPPLCTDFYHGKWQSAVLGGGPLQGSTFAFDAAPPLTPADQEQTPVRASQGRVALPPPHTH